MNSFNEWMEEHFVPIAAKIGSQKHLVAIRDAFIGIMPITMAGSIAVLLNVFLRDLPSGAGMVEFVAAMQPIIGVNGNVWWASNAILSLAFVFSLGYNLSKTYDVNPLAGGLVTLSSLITTMPQVASFVQERVTSPAIYDVLSKLEGFSFKLTKDGSIFTDEAGNYVELINASGWGFFSQGYTSVSGLFTAMMVGLVCGMIYVTLMRKKITIKLPDSVPPAVSGAFAAIIPGVVAIYFMAIASYLVATYAGTSINDLINMYVQKPLMNLSQGLGSVILISILVQLFWFFGLHGTNLLAPILDGVYKPALLENLAHYQATGSTADMPYIWTRGSFDAFAWMGGAGCSLAIIVALLIFSKREDQRTVAKLSAPMGLFNINEPVVFGLPLVLNPIYLIPFLFVPVILVIIAFFATQFGLVPPVFVEVAWVVPPGIYAFLATGGSFAAALLSIVNFAIGVILWAPFVKIANKVGIDK